MTIVRIGVHETDAHGFDAVLFEFFNSLHDILLVDGCDDLSSIIHPFLNRAPQESRHQGTGWLITIVVKLLTDSASHLKDVSQSFRGEEPCFCTRLGECCVSRDGCPVDNRIHMLDKTLDLHPLISSHRLKAIHHTNGRILRGGGFLVDPGIPSLIHEKEIGESSPDIDADLVFHLRKDESSFSWISISLAFWVSRGIESGGTSSISGLTRRCSLKYALISS